MRLDVKNGNSGAVNKNELHKDARTKETAQITAQRHKQLSAGIFCKSRTENHDKFWCRCKNNNEFAMIKNDCDQAHCNWNEHRKVCELEAAVMCTGRQQENRNALWCRCKSGTKFATQDNCDSTHCKWHNEAKECVRKRT